MYNIVTGLGGGAGSLEEEVRSDASFRGWNGESDRCKSNPKDGEELIDMI